MKISRKSAAATAGVILMGSTAIFGATTAQARTSQNTQHSIEKDLHARGQNPTPPQPFSQPTTKKDAWLEQRINRSGLEEAISALRTATALAKSTYQLRMTEAGKSHEKQLNARLDYQAAVLAATLKYDLHTLDPIQYPAVAAYRNALGVAAGHLARATTQASLNYALEIETAHAEYQKAIPHHRTPEEHDSAQNKYRDSLNRSNIEQHEMLTHAEAAFRDAISAARDGAKRALS